jgi:hypothetical protein
MTSLAAVASVAGIAVILQSPPADRYKKPAEKPPVAASSGIPIFVGPQMRDGFVDVDRGVLDSIKDIKGELEGRKELRLVADKNQAQLVLEVLSRGATSTSGGGAAAMPIGTSTFLIPIGTIGIATVLRVGGYEKPIVFQNCQSWRYCARLVAKDVDAWVAANATTLQQQQAEVGSPPAASDSCEALAQRLADAPGSTLAAKIRSLSPESYANMTDEKLASLYRTTFPCLAK